ncbi:hypothetical protein SAMN04488581_2627 [Mycolicibacterium neoaurum]|nr:hypothetical protein SAMN04488581_2627 [Mycolicibacterium neoaurum]
MATINRLSVRIFGREVFAINMDRDQPNHTEPQPPRMEAGAGHNFERDLNPPNPSGEEPWFPDDKFGFHR